MSDSCRVQFFDLGDLVRRASDPPDKVGRVTQANRDDGPSPGVFYYTVEYPHGYRAGVSQEDLVGAELHGAAPTEADDGEQVNHPDHYGGDSIYEVHKVLEAWGLIEHHYLASAVEYLARVDKKGASITNLEKAIYQLGKEIAYRTLLPRERNRFLEMEEGEALDGGVLPSWPDTASATNNTVTYAISDPAGAGESKLAVLDAELQKRGIWRTFDEDRDVWKFFDAGHKGPRCVKLMGEIDFVRLSAGEILDEVVRAAADVEAAERDFHANPDEEETAEECQEIRKLMRLDLVLGERKIRRTFNQDLHTHEFYLLSSAGYRPFLVVADSEVERMEPLECAEWLEHRLQVYRKERQQQIIDSRGG